MKLVIILAVLVTVTGCKHRPMSVEAPAPGRSSQVMIENHQASTEAERRCGGVAHTGRSGSTDRDKQTAWEMCTRASR